MTPPQSARGKPCIWHCLAVLVGLTLPEFGFTAGNAGGKDVDWAKEREFWSFRAPGA